MPPASLAPPDSHCAVHATAPAATICGRCGGFMCGECSKNNQENLCPKCRPANGFDAAKLARAYRSLVMWFGVQLVVTVGNPALGDSGLVRGIAGLVTVATLVALTLYSYRTAAALGASVPVLWAIAMFVPCVNIITLLVLSSKATAACRERGIAVGFLGPKI